MEGVRTRLKQDLIKFGLMASQFNKDLKEAASKGAKLSFFQLNEWITAMIKIALELSGFGENGGNLLEDMAKGRGVYHALVRSSP